MKTIILFALTISLSFFMSSCDVLFPDEKLSMQRENYNGNEVRTDGYYYMYYTNSTNQESIIVFFLYRNGVMLSAGAYGRNDFDIVEEEMLERYESFQRKKIGWGVFIVLGNKLEYEQWSTSVGGGLPVFKSFYYIENDTTLRSPYERIYHFKQFSPKPDSIAANKWIK